MQQIRAISFINRAAERFQILTGVSWKRSESYFPAVGETRGRPAGDEKILTDWNGLMIAALGKASLLLDDPQYLHSAERAFEFITENMVADNQRLTHSFAGGRRCFDAFLDDCAFLIRGSLGMYNATLNREYLQFAIDLQRELDMHFADQSDGGYFFTADYADLQIARLKESYDGAVPSGNSLELTNLISLWKLTGDSSYLEQASGIESAFSGSVASAVSARVCRNGTCALPVATVSELRDLL
ncbi:MAG: thioredoxin domain-containing protein [Candidatus Sabulitectum sp.]|nr:thioredoxin domain-containing protein [Candidatus Sabulitectum sp.]